MHATTTRGRRALAVISTAALLVLPAAAASAAPADAADDRAHEAHETNANRQEERTEGSTSSGTITEDTDEGADDGDDVPNAPDVNGDDDNRHPSGRDRSQETGGSGNQGRAQHDPDDDGNGPDRSNGGLDQPGGQGGVDRDDQDGNNGCGNDDDFEDDNEGLCGGNPQRGGPAGAEQDVDDRDVEREDAEDRQAVIDADADVTSEASQRPTAVDVADQDVAGVMVVADRAETPEETAVATDAFETDTEVMGVTWTAEAPAGTGDVLAAAPVEDSVAEDAGTLPRTGAGLAGLAVFGLSSIAGGTALSRRRR